MGRLLLCVCALTFAGCASSGARPQPFPTPGAGLTPDRDRPAAPDTPAAPAHSAGGAGYAIAGTALSLRGTPYRDGGSDPSGFDCSGFVWYVFGQHGIRVPRTVSDLYRTAGTAPEPLEPGDLIFFATTGSGPSHVGILIGGDEFVHAPSSSGQVRVEHMSAAYWSARYLGARRVR